jgi:drug/metabolite transporter (DMT)-like permease
MGLLACTLSALFATSKDLLSKRFASRLDGTTSTYASFAYALPFYLIVLAVLVEREMETFTLTQSFLLLVLLRSVTDVFAEGMKMHALAHGDLSVVATFFSISPLFLLVTSPLVTGDPLSTPRVLAVCLVVVGSLALVYRPSAAHWSGQGKGIALATGASFFFSLNSCFDRLAVQKGTPVFAGFSMTLLSAVFLLPLVLRRDRQASLRQHRAGLLLRGLLEVAFMSGKLIAIQSLQAPDVVAIQRLSLVLSILAGRFLFGEPDFLRRLAAAILIAAGIILTVWMQW